MEINQVHGIARRLFEAHGPKAEAEAAQQLQEAEKEGDDNRTQLWRRIRSSIQEMKAARQT